MGNEQQPSPAVRGEKPQANRETRQRIALLYGAMRVVHQFWTDRHIANQAGPQVLLEVGYLIALLHATARIIGGESENIWPEYAPCQQVRVFGGAEVRCLGGHDDFWEGHMGAHEGALVTWGPTSEALTFFLTNSAAASGVQPPSGAG